MNRYPSYKPSGVNWLGEIPSHWEVKRWRFLMSENTTKNSNCKERLQLQFRYGDIVRKANQSEESDVLDTITKYTIVEPDDIMINGLNLNYDFISQRVAQVQERGVITSAYISLRPTEIANSKYFTYFLKSMDAKKMFHGMGTGIRLTLSYNELKNQFIPCPSPDEQTAIANYLDTVTAKIDAAIVQQQKMIDLLNERKQIIINRAVTKGLNPNAKMKDSGVEWIGEVPEHWEVRRLKYLLRQIAVPSSSLNKIGLENIESGTGKFIKTNSEYEGNGIQFEKGDILYGKLRPYLKKVFLAEESGNAVGDFFVFRPNDIVEGKYMQLVLLSQTLTNEINSSTYGAKMPRVSIDFMGGLNIPLPSLIEQKVIVESIHKDCKPIDDAISAANNQISLLQERKQIIINEVVTGKVKVG